MPCLSENGWQTMFLAEQFAPQCLQADQGTAQEAGGHAAIGDLGNGLIHLSGFIVGIVPPNNYIKIFTLGQIKLWTIIGRASA